MAEITTQGSEAVSLNFTNSVLEVVQEFIQDRRRLSII